MTVSDDVMIQPDWTKNGITLGVMFGSLLIGHMLLFIISYCIKKDQKQPMMMQKNEDVRQTLEAIEN